MPDQSPPSGAQAPALAVDAIKALIAWAHRKPNAQYAYSRCRVCGASWWDNKELHRRDCPVRESSAQLTALLEAVEEGRKDKIDAERWRQIRKMLWIGTTEDGAMMASVGLTEDDAMDDDFIITEEAAPYLTKDERAQISGQAAGDPDYASCADRAIDAARTPNPAREEQTDE